MSVDIKEEIMNTDIKGIVRCECGGIIISNSGKVLIDVIFKNIHCWDCHKSYNAVDVYAVREEGKMVVYNSNKNKFEDLKNEFYENFVTYRSYYQSKKGIVYWSDVWEWIEEKLNKPEHGLNS